jgi:hypothetical protein
MSNSLVTALLSFLEVAVHSILHIRELYPSSFFERRRKYGIPVWMSRQPDLNAFIVKVLRNAKPHFDRGLVRRVVVPISGPDSVVLESYVFTFANYAAGPALQVRGVVGVAIVGIVCWWWCCCSKKANPLFTRSTLRLPAGEGAGGLVQGVHHAPRHCGHAAATVAHFCAWLLHFQRGDCDGG